MLRRKSVVMWAGMVLTSLCLADRLQSKGLHRKVASQAEKVLRLKQLSRRTTRTTYRSRKNRKPS